MGAAFAVADVDEDDAAQIAAGMDPAGEGDGLPDALSEQGCHPRRSGAGGGGNVGPLGRKIDPAASAGDSLAAIDERSSAIARSDTSMLPPPGTALSV